MVNGGLPREEWAEYMQRTQAGDGQAWARLLHTLVPVIRALIRKQITDDDLTEDVIQDVLLTLHRIRHTWDPTCPFLPWLMAITRARTVDALRQRGRHRRREVIADEEAMAVIDSTPAQDLEHQDSSDELEGFLNQLPARQRQIVEHVHLQEMSLAQAAQKNNLTISAVKSLLHRALSNLRRSGATHDRS